MEIKKIPGKNPYCIKQKIHKFKGNGNSQIRQFIDTKSYRHDKSQTQKYLR